MSDTPDTPLPLSEKIIETGASVIQDFTPLKNVCAYLNAFHVYTNATSASPGPANPSPPSSPSSSPPPPRAARAVEAHHYCMHLTPTLRQCIVFDSARENARLIGIEYLVSRDVFEALPLEERRLWHSHAFEVRSGMLVMPGVWDAVETREMRELVGWYGKTWHLWQVDRGDPVPLGVPQLMGSFTGEEEACAVVGREWEERDRRLGVDRDAKVRAREGIEVPDVVEGADAWMRK